MPVRELSRGMVTILTTSEAPDGPTRLGPWTLLAGMPRADAELVENQFPDQDV